MNAEFKTAITILTIIFVLMAICLIGAGIVCTLIVLDVIKTSLLIKILASIVDLCIVAFGGISIYYCVKGEK